MHSLKLFTKGKHIMPFAYSTFEYNMFNIRGTVPVFQFLSLNPSGSQSMSNINAVGNYLATPVEFTIVPPPGYIIVLNHATATVRDAGKFASGNYGKDIELINGISIFFGVPGVSALQRPITAPNVPIMTNPDWEIYSMDTNLSNYGVGEEQLCAQWRVDNLGRQVILDGDDGTGLIMRLNDDFSDLVKHYFHVQGLLIKKKGD